MEPMDLNFNFAAHLNRDTLNQKLILWYCFEMLEKSFNHTIQESHQKDLNVEEIPKYKELKALLDWWIYRRDYYGEEFNDDQSHLIELINLRQYL